MWGEFFNGSIRTLSINRARLVVSDHLSLEPGVSLNLIDLPVGEANQTVFRLRADYAFTPRMFASTLMQFNESSSTFSSNVRFRWEYRPGSALFLVWSQGRDDSAPTGAFDFAGDMRDLFSVTPDNVFMVKFSYWMSR